MTTKLIWDRSSQDTTAGYSEQGNWQILRATGIADVPESLLSWTPVKRADIANGEPARQLRALKSDFQKFA